MAEESKESPPPLKTWPSVAKEEVDRVNARLRHFRGVAAVVMSDALELWRELYDAFQDQRTCEEIMDDIPASPSPPAFGELEEYLEKLYLLGTYIDYAKRLCEGSIHQPIQQESEVEACPDSSPSFQPPNHVNRTRFCRRKRK